MNIKLHTLLSCAIVIVTGARSQDPFHRSFTVEDGLPSNLVYCALQDHEGYMWFGTDAGVSRFDGVEFTNLGPADGLSDNEVIGIHEDSSHRIWFLTLNGMLSYWLNGAVHNARTDPKLGRFRAGSGWSTFCEDDKGGLWFGGIRGEALRLDPRGEDDVFLPADFLTRSVVIDPTGTVVSLRFNTIERFDGHKFVRSFEFAEGWLTSHVQQPPASDHAPVGLSAAGVFEVSAAGITLLPGTEGQIDARSHRAVMRDEHGDIWLSRKDEGVDFLAHDTGGYRESRHQFGDLKINTVCVTGEGDRWYCTASQGVLLVDRQVVEATACYPNDRNSGSAYISIAQETDRIWIGTDLGHILTLDDGVLRPRFQPNEGRLPGRILRIVPEGRGKVWFGTDWGLFRWNADAPDELGLIPAFERVKGELVEAPAPAKSVLVARDGRVWSPGIGLWRHAGDSKPVREHYITDKLDRLRIYSIAQDASGAIWVADGARMISVRDSTITEHLLPEALSALRISDIVHIGGDTLALATAGQGVLLWRNDRLLAMLGPDQGLVSGMVRKLRCAGDTLWCVTSLGVSALMLKRGVVVDTWTWGVHQGLPTNNVYDVCLVGNRLYMATARGLCIAPHRPTRIDRAPPRLVLAHLAVNDSLVDPGQGQQSLGTNDRVRVDVHALEFANAGMVQYAYSIDGGGDWSPCAQGRVIIEGLDEGAHVIRVRARHPDGEWSVPLSVSLLARPPWWASYIAKTAATFGGIAILSLALYYWSRRGFRKKLERMRSMAALNEERRRIAADVHDDLGADLSRVLMHARRLESAVPEEAGSSVSQGIAATIDKIDEIIWSLDPKRDTLRSTVHFIEQQAREMAEAHGLSYRTVVELPEVDVPLSAADRRELMLIAREALRNIVEHSRATTVRVEWHLSGPELRMIVEDDGLGFTPSADSGYRNGIANMRERAGKLHGTLTIGPVEPHGARIDLRMPLKSNHPIG